MSASDKTGLVEFLKALPSLNLELVSTGGTYEYLKKNNLPVIDVSQVTGFPEVLDGRVKTLHPNIHMGILADQQNAAHMDQMKTHNVKVFDMIVGNLYPFEKTALNPDATFDELIENIDIGGPSFLRAAAKNHRSVIVVCDPSDYSWIQQKINLKTFDLHDRLKLALKVFSMTSYYDAMIVSQLGGASIEAEYLNLPLRRKQALRYGENPQQMAAWYVNPLEKRSLASAQIHQGKELSYNNILDLEASVQLARQFDLPACVAVKHNNPCGVAVGISLHEAAAKAIDSDPKSIFGGIVALNREVDLQTAELFKDIFLECIVAPAFLPEVLQFFSTKKNLRLLSWPQMNAPSSTSYEVKSISGGFLVQQSDTYDLSSWHFLSLKPDDSIMRTMQFGDFVAGSLKSNAIALVYKGQTVGLGMGQVNRVDAVCHALERMREFSQRVPIDISQVVLASDAFFPFADSIELIAQAGIKWIVQPGGSVQDKAVIEAAQKYSINMVMTGRRHFKH